MAKETTKVSVASKPERFRRAGLEFTREPRNVEVDAKTLQALKEESMLVVSAPVKEATEPSGT